MNSHRKAIAALLLGVSVIAGTVATAQHAAQPAKGPTSKQPERSQARAPKVMVVAFHADWCPGCQALGPKLMNEVIPSVKGEPYLLVKLDQTDRGSAQAEYMLAALGLGHLWSEHGGKTGFALVVDTETKRVLNTFTYNQEPGDMTRALKAALKG